MLVGVASLTAVCTSIHGPSTALVARHSSFNHTVLDASTSAFSFNIVHIKVFKAASTTLSSVSRRITHGHGLWGWDEMLFGLQEPCISSKHWQRCEIENGQATGRTPVLELPTFWLG